MSVENFLSHIAERFVLGGGGKPSALCFRFFLAAKSVWKKREGGYQDFRSKFFCLTLPENFVRKPFCVSKKVLFGKFSRIGGGHHGFAGNFVVSQYQKSSQRNPSVLCFRKFPKAKKFYG